MAFSHAGNKMSPDGVARPQLADPNFGLLQIAQIAMSAARMCAWDADLIARTTTYLGDPEVIFGCTPAADYVTGFRALVHPDDIEGLESNLARQAETSELYEDQFRIGHRDGSIRWIYARGRFVHDSSGKAIHLIGVNVDVTEQKSRDHELTRVRAAALDQYSLIETLVNNMPAMLCYMREPGKVHWVNGAWEKVLGWTPEDNGGELASLLYPDAEEAARVRDFISRADGEVGEFKTRTKSGRVIDTAWVNINLADGTNIGIGRDISDQKFTMSRLRESELRFRMISDNIPQLVWITDSSGATVYYNQRWYDYTGQTQEHALGNGWRDVMHPDELDSNQLRWERSAREGTEFENELRLRRHDGEFRWFLIRATPVRNEHGAIENWFGTSTDITEKKFANEALVRAEKLAMAGRFAASVAHEINNPLTAVTNIHYLLATDESVPQHIRERLLVADGELRRISHILRQTLAFYRENARHEAVSLQSLVDELLNIFGPRLESRAVSLQVRIPAPLTAWASAGEVRQVLCNLVANSLDAITKNGRIIIRGRLVQGAHSKPLVRMTLADNGCGFDRRNAERIFEPFFTTKDGVGTGLGLWVSRQLVQRNGGILRARSRLGRGTVFTLDLPAVIQERKPEPKARLAREEADPEESLQLN